MTDAPLGTMRAGALPVIHPRRSPTTLKARVGLAPTAFQGFTHLPKPAGQPTLAEKPNYKSYESNLDFPRATDRRIFFETVMGAGDFAGRSFRPVERTGARQPRYQPWPDSCQTAGRRGFVSLEPVARRAGAGHVYGGWKSGNRPGAGGCHR